MPAAHIYTLDDPETGLTRYVGKTILDLKERLRGHMKEKRRTAKCNWVQSLKRRGLKPVIEEIEAVDEKDSAEAERFWICSLRFLGCRLLNLHDGGDGGPQPPEVRAKMRESARRRHRLNPMSAETRAKMAAARIGLKKSAETRAKMSALLKGRPKSPEHAAHCRAALVKGRQTAYTPEAIAKNVAANRGRKNSPETIAKMRERRLAYWQRGGHPTTPETRAKISAAGKGRVVSAETRAKISAAEKGRLGKIPSEETRAKLSAALRERWAKFGDSMRGRKASPETRAKMSAAHKDSWARSKVHERA